MKNKKAADAELTRVHKKTKSIKILPSCSHMDRPKISIEGKWLEERGFHIGDLLKVEYGEGMIAISHAYNRVLMVCEPESAYAAGSADDGQADRCRKPDGLKHKQIKVAASFRIRQTRRYGEPFCCQERSKIRMEGKWLDSLGFHVGDRVRVECAEGSIYIYPAA